MRVYKFVANALVSGVLIVVPVYLALLLLLRAMKSLIGFVAPIARLLPGWLPAGVEDLLAFLGILIVCFIIGVAVRTRVGRALRARIEKSIFMGIPGYELFRSLMQQLAGDGEEHVWRPAMAEIEEALVPAFIIEEFEDGRYTVYVPSVPSPFSGAVYILTPERVHPLDASFRQTVQALSRWGSGSKQLVEAMERKDKG